MFTCGYLSLDSLASLASYFVGVLGQSAERNEKVSRAPHRAQAFALEAGHHRQKGERTK